MNAPPCLCKADLTTDMVKEFTELQGVVGGLYAKAQGEGEAVATAIYDHYKPVSMDDSIPRTLEGQIVSIADKLDTLTGMLQNRSCSHWLERSFRAAPRRARHRQNSLRSAIAARVDDRSDEECLNSAPSSTSGSNSTCATFSITPTTK